MSLEKPTEEEIQEALKYDAILAAKILGPLQSGGAVEYIQNGIAALHILQEEVKRLRAKHQEGEK